jgi:hypothetical protein
LSQPSINRESNRSVGSRSLAVAGLIIIGLLGFLALPSGGYASTGPLQAATYTIVTTTGSIYGNPGQLECSSNGCTYVPSSYQYRFNPQTPGYYNGVYYAYVNGGYYPPCQANITNHMVSCSGFIYQAQTGCTELVVVVANANLPGSYSYQYYTLHNLSSSPTINGQFVSVPGQFHLGANSSPTGAACPGNYINVTSIS